jgi:hypothetical protein
MPSDLESSICFLEETNNPANAYFSFSVDSTGEYGIIKANKEGLRLYAAEILKKSLLLENCRDGKPLFFGDLPWVVSDAGYDVVAGIQPEYLTRPEILSAETSLPDPATYEGRHPQASGHPGKESPAPAPAPATGKGCFVLFLCIIGSLILLATAKAFPNLRSWVNIR